MSRRPAGVTGAPVCAAQEGTTTVGRKPIQFESDYAAVLQVEYQRRARDKDGTVLSNNAVNGHVRRAKLWDFIEAESNRRCLVLPMHRFQKGVGDETCEEHGIRPAKRFRP